MSVFPMLVLEGTAAFVTPNPSGPTDPLHLLLLLKDIRCTLGSSPG